MSKNQHKICIIGAGVSGLVTAKVFIEAGYSVKIFEKKSSLGGVWEATRTYPGLTTQTPGSIYSFSDYPIPKNYPEWPTAEQIRNYLQSYAEKFNIYSIIHFETEVVSVESNFLSNGAVQWFVKIRSQNGFTQIKIFDFLIICNGTCCCPNIPHLIGDDSFVNSGCKIIHSSEFNDISLLKDKKVLIAGFGKSAIDIATIAADVAINCTLVFKKPDWKMPRYLLKIINSKYIFATRLSESLLPYYRMNIFERFIHLFFKPLIWLFWRISEKILCFQMNLNTAQMIPSENIEKSLTCSTGTIPDGFYDKVILKKIDIKRGYITKLLEREVQISTGENIPVDVVILATGFRIDLSFLPVKYRNLIFNNGYLSLYRNIIHPDVPAAGFIGYNSSFFTPLTSEMAARWLLDYFQGNLHLPSKAEMILEMHEKQKWDIRLRQGVSIDGSCVAPFSLHYIEQLMQDMKISRKANICQLLKNLILPVDPSTYSTQYIKKRYNSQSR